MDLDKLSARSGMLALASALGLILVGWPMVILMQAFTLHQIWTLLVEPHVGWALAPAVCFAAAVIWRWLRRDAQAAQPVDFDDEVQATRDDLARMLDEAALDHPDLNADVAAARRFVARLKAADRWEAFWLGVAFRLDAAGSQAWCASARAEFEGCLIRAFAVLALVHVMHAVMGWA